MSLPSGYYQAQVTGGTAPFTYQWSIKTDNLGWSPFLGQPPKSLQQAIIPGSNTNSSVDVQNTGDSNIYAHGLLQVKVTDATGRVAYGYYEVMKPGVGA